MLFIHIPKNGGALFVRYGIENNKKWESYKEAHDLMTKEDYEKFKDWKIITIVRNCYERVVSLYRFRCLIKKTDSFKNFEDFVLNFEWKEELFNQLHWFRVDDKNIVDQIIMYDKNNLVKSIVKIFKDEKPKIPRKNDAVHFYGNYNFKDYYTPKAKEEVERICKEEIALFNFKY